MGTINYGKSEYITMGFENPVTAYELLEDSAWVESERRFLLIDIDFGRDIWDEEDKQAALEEVEQIRAFLHECNGLGMRADIMEIDTSEDGTA